MSIDDASRAVKISLLDLSGTGPILSTEKNEPVSVDGPKETALATPSKTFIHDLRNMLSPIRNAAYLLRLRAAQDANLLSIADQIDRQIKSIGNLLDAPEHVPSATPLKLPAIPHKSRRLLIADDSDAVRLSFSQVLEEMGHEVRAARDGEEAMEMALDWVPECVLLDVQMPKLNGIEVARRLRAKFPFGTMKLVMMSGDNLNEHTISAARQAGFDHCADKIDGLEFLNQFMET